MVHLARGNDRIILNISMELCVRNLITLKLDRVRSLYLLFADFVSNVLKVCSNTRSRSLNGHLLFSMAFAANGASWTWYSTNDA